MVWARNFKVTERWPRVMGRERKRVMGQPVRGTQDCVRMLNLTKDGSLMAFQARDDVYSEGKQRPLGDGRASRVWRPLVSIPAKPHRGRVASRSQAASPKASLGGSNHSVKPEAPA